jgi:[ribosomal protein S5]-alanine N-acetyltransferase
VLVRSPLHPADAAELCAHYGQPDVRRHLWDDEAPDRATVDAIIARSQADEVGPGYWMGALRERVGGPLIGSCGLREVPGHAGRVELVYSLDPAWWGRGLITEVAQAALADGFDRCGLPEILAGVDAENQRSQAVLARLGMEPIGELVVHGSPVRYHRITADAFGRRVGGRK